MPAVLLEVEPAAFDAACRVFGLDVAAPLANAADVLLGSLAGCGGMAGSDDAGRRWASSYDAAAGSAVGAVQDVVNGCYRLAALLEQTGFNHGLAEDASVPGGVGIAADRTRWGGYAVTLGQPPSAAGVGSSGMPPGWSLVEHAVGYVWPNGHQDRLRAASAAWSAMADALDVAAWGVPEALAAISGQRSPEVPDALAACEGMQRHFRDLAATCSALGSACTEYAAHLDECHSAVEHEIASLMEWTAGIQAGGAVLAVFSAGISEVAAQGAEASRIAQTAARVAALIERLINAANAVAETIASTARQVLDVRANLQTLLDSRLVMAAVDGVPPMRVFMVANAAGRSAPAAVNTAERSAQVRLALDGVHRRLASLRPERRWRSVPRLIRHFEDHAVDFGVVDADEYTELATGFFRRAISEQLPTKIDEDLTIRIFDPASNTFGSYGSDGTIFTFFKPTSRTYWERQPGSDPWR